LGKATQSFFFSLGLKGELILLQQGLRQSSQALASSSVVNEMGEFLAPNAKTSLPVLSISGQSPSLSPSSDSISSLSSLVITIVHGFWSSNTTVHLHLIQHFLVQN